jgi:predicted dehydrogenase
MGAQEAGVNSQDKNKDAQHDFVKQRVAENRILISRRQFLQTSAIGAASLFASPLIVRAQNAINTKLNVAFIGTGGRGESHLHLAQSQKCIAYADVDTNHWGKIKELAPKATGYTDWRQMFDKHLKEIDVVVVSTPDHTHALPALRAIQAGKHVYCEKPLTWSIEEARVLAEATAQKKVATQMGNQGHANQGTRIVVEWIRDGAIGDVKEVHTWTNRPVWAQGNLQRGAVKPVPANLNWDAWLGPAPFRDFHDGLHGFAWRGWFEFGCGAVGDMGCHTWDNVFWAMNPDYPSSVELLEIENKGTETYPSKSHFKWEFPAKGNRPAFTAHWYSGGWRPPVPEEMLSDPTRQKENGEKPKLPDSGSLYIGTKGKLLVSGDYADSPRLIPESFMREYKRPAPSIERSPGHMEEFIMACKGEKPWNYPGSNFANYAGPLTEVMLLGAISERIGQVGFKIECDPVKRTIKTKEALALRGREYRKGWELK